MNDTKYSRGGHPPFYEVGQPKPCRKCGKEFPNTTVYFNKRPWGTSSWCRKCTSKYNVKVTRESRHRYKKVVFAHYGGKCVCCGEWRPEFLTIDHINNDGKVARKENGGWNTPYKYQLIVKLGFPTDLQILCWNCNAAKEFSGGCPHYLEQLETVV